MRVSARFGAWAVAGQTARRSRQSRWMVFDEFPFSHYDAYLIIMGMACAGYVDAAFVARSGCLNGLEALIMGLALGFDGFLICFGEGVDQPACNQHETQ